MRIEGDDGAVWRGGNTISEIHVLLGGSSELSDTQYSCIDLIFRGISEMSRNQLTVETKVFESVRLGR